MGAATTTSAGRGAGPLRDGRLTPSRGGPGMPGRPRSDLQLAQGAWVGVIAVVILLGGLWGYAIAFAEVNAALLGVSLLACAFILFDFRLGVVLLVLLMPIAASQMFPRAMFGITGLNPVNLLLAATLLSYLLRGAADGSLRRFLPPRLLWLYVAPVVVAGVVGSRHADEIAAPFRMLGLVEFSDTAGYLRDVLLKPLFMVLFALLVAAAVRRSADPRRFLVPTTISMWIMCLLLIGFVASAASSIFVLADSSERSFLAPLGVHANDLGRMYAVGYALLLFTFAGTRDYLARAALLASMAVVVLALGLTFSRGAFVGFVIVNALFLLWRRSTITWIIAGLVFMVVLWKAPGVFYDRITTGFGGDWNAISAGRVDGIWMPLLPEIGRNILFGNGLGAILWSDAIASGSMEVIGHPHNAYLRTVMDMGLAGLALVLAYFVHVWKGFRRLAAEPSLPPSMRGFYEGAAAGLASFLIAGMAGSSLTPVPEQVFLWLAIGMMYGQLSEQRSPKPAGARPRSAHA